MRKNVWISLIILIFVSISVFASGANTFSLKGGAWVAISDEKVPENSPKTPTASPNSNEATPLVYAYIEYTNVKAHIDSPGDWMMGNITITTIASHTPITLTFSTSGNLRNGSLTLPTYYQQYDGNDSNHIPHQPLHAAVWRPANKDWPHGMNGYQTTRGIGNHSFKLWMGVKVKDNTQKGRYTGWIQISITQVP